MGKAIKIGKSFFWDHTERDLPTPVVLKETGKHFVIDCDDPALPELLNDARHYAGAGTDAPSYIVSAAHALLRAVERQCA